MKLLFFKHEGGHVTHHLHVEFHEKFTWKPFLNISYCFEDTGRQTREHSENGLF